MNEHDFETRLRDSLHRNALRAPPGDPLADRLLDRFERAPVPPRHQWRAWALPLAVAAAVAIAGTIVGLAQIRHPNGTPAASVAPAPTQPSASTPSLAIRSGAPPNGSPLTSTAATMTMPARGSAQPAVPTGLRDVQIQGVDFIGPQDGYLLAEADCAQGAGRCGVLLRTTDGGAHWTAAEPPPAPVGVGGCPTSTPCVQQIRFATRRTGYAYGPDVLFLTTNGGHTWNRQSGIGADALTIAGDSVVLVRTVDTACPQRCPLFVRSTVGSSRWTPFRVPDRPEGVDVSASLAGRGNHIALLLSSVNTARGNGRNQSGALYLSADGGRHWTARGEPCPKIGTGYTDESSAMAMSSTGAIVMDCTVRSFTEPNLLAGITITSTDGGVRFDAPPHGGKLEPATAIAAASATVQLAYARRNGGAPRLYRSTDSGDTWSPVTTIAGGIAWIGFQSAAVGHIISQDRRTLWTTRDAGAAWTSRAFP